MTKTTEQWEALLDGTADGPWEAERHGNEPVISIRTIAHTPKRYVGDIYGEWNARLAAAAPEAVAEVIRLRKAIEERTRVWNKIAEKISARGDEETAWLVKSRALQLVNILEGDTDE